MSFIGYLFWFEIKLIINLFKRIVLKIFSIIIGIKKLIIKPKYVYIDSTLLLK